MKNKQTLRETMKVLSSELATWAAKRRFILSVAGTAVPAALAFLGMELVVLYEGVIVYGPESASASLHAMTASDLLRGLNPLFIRASIYACVVGSVWGLLTEAANAVKRQAGALTAA